MPEPSARTAAADFRGVRRLGVFGGSFDPVHAGHLHVARAASAAFDLERVVWVPAARPPHKPGRALAPDADRLRMLELALADEPRWSIATLELEREGPSYTVDTLRALPARLGLAADCALFLLIGGDNLGDLPRWREAATVLALARPIVVRRAGDDPAVLARLERELEPALRERVRAGLLELPPVEVSSTALREALARGEDPGAALPRGVLEYIRARGLYRGA